jgi:hypothetical protein
MNRPEDGRRGNYGLVKTQGGALNVRTLKAITVSTRRLLFHAKIHESRRYCHFLLSVGFVHLAMDMARA